MSSTRIWVSAYTAPLCGRKSDVVGGGTLSVPVKPTGRNPLTRWNVSTCWAANSPPR